MLEGGHDQCRSFIGSKAGLSWDNDGSKSLQKVGFDMMKD